MAKRIQILVVLGILLMITGIILNITTDSFLWCTGTVTTLFIIMLFGIDPLSPRNKDRIKRI